MLATDRPGYQHGGILVEYRDKVTDDLLWESAIPVLPRAADTVQYAVGEGALTEYVVDEVKFDFRKMTMDDSEGDPQEVVTGLSDCTPIVIVELV